MRGHQFVTQPAVAFLSNTAFQQAVLDQVASTKPAVDQAEVAFKALGWLPASGNLYHEYQIAFSGGVVGFYDPSTKVLDVRGTDITPYRRAVCGAASTVLRCCCSMRMMSERPSSTRPKLLGRVSDASRRSRRCATRCST